MLEVFECPVSITVGSQVCSSMLHFVHEMPIVVLTLTTGRTKFGARHVFSSRKCQMKLVGMVKLIAAPMHGRQSHRCYVASASSLQDDCIDAYRNVKIATPSVQDSTVTSEAGVGVSCSSAPDVSRSPTAVITALNSATASSACCWTCEELATENRDFQRFLHRLEKVAAPHEVDAVFFCKQSQLKHSTTPRHITTKERDLVGRCDQRDAPVFTKVNGRFMSCGTAGSGNGGNKAFLQLLWHMKNSSLKKLRLPRRS